MRKNKTGQNTPEIGSVHNKLTTTQISRALLWTGSLTQACAILEMPFRRAWNYVSGKPVSIRPVLRGPKAETLGRTRSRIEKNGYTFAELLNLRLAETLLSAGISGETVQELIDSGFVSDGLKAPNNGQADATIVIVYHDIDGPAVMAFPPGKESDVKSAVDAAFEIGAARCLLSAGSIMQEVLRRTVFYQEHRPYVAKSPHQILKEAGSRRLLSDMHP
jgi:hypothetical protein